MPTRLAASLLLLAIATAPAFAREARQLGANGDGGCPDRAAAAADAEMPAARRAAARDPAAQRETSVRPAASRGGDEGARPPRWHSFLPGMFR